MLQLRLASEAAGQAGALGLVFGEGLRVSALGNNIPIDSRISSVTLDRAMFIASGAIVSIVGVVAAFLLMPLSHALRLYAVLFTVIFVQPALCRCAGNAESLALCVTVRAGILPIDLSALPSGGETAADPFGRK